MIRYIVRRLLASLPVLFGVVALVFIIARVLPGDPCTAMYAEKATKVVCDAFNTRYGLDKSILDQFAIYVGALLQGDLGASILFGRDISTILIERLPVTVELTVLSLLFAVSVGVPLGIASAIRRNSPVDVVTMGVANLGVSIPVFVLGLFLAYVFAVILRDTPFVLPPGGRLSPGIAVVPLAVRWGLQDLHGPLRLVVDFASNMYVVNGLVTGTWSLLGDALRHLILPAVAVGTIPLAIIARMTRSSLLEVLGQDFVRTARAKGLRERLVVVRHGLRNAMLPVVTVIGLSIGSFLSGAVLTETIFGLSGMGRMLYEGIVGRDYSIIQGATVVIAVIYVVVNLVVDISYAFLDPRIRLS